MKFIRMRPSGVQVPEITYKNKNKEIVIQGAVHIGDRRFYEKILDKIKGFDGEVHLEGIISTKEENLHNKHLLDSIYSTFASVLNLDYQKTYINKNLCDNRKIFNYDIEDVEITDKIFNKEMIDNLKKFTQNNKTKLLNNHVLNIGSSPLSNMVLMSVGSSNVSIDNEDIILHRRNKVALDKALKTKNNVYLFWGAKHIDGMNTILVNEGYTVKSIKWKTVIPTIRWKGNKSLRKETISANMLKIEELLYSC